MAELQIPNYMINRPESIADLAESAIRMQANTQAQKINEMKMAAAQEEMNRENQFRQAFANGMPQVQDLYKIDPLRAQQYEENRSQMANNQFNALTKQHAAARDIATAIVDRKSTRLNSSHIPLSRMPSSA